MSGKTCRTYKVLVLVSACVVSMVSNAFCNGTVTGQVVTDLDKNKEDAVVYLKGVKASPVPRKVLIEQHHMTFIPKVTTIPVGSTVEFTNHDKIYHNVFSKSAAKTFNIGTYAAGKPKDVVFDKPGVVDILCNVHPEMAAFVVVTENNAATVSDKSGAFTITDVPAGTYEVGVWHGKLKQEGSVTVTVADGAVSRINVKLGN
jgi:plastocyanin